MIKLVGKGDLLLMALNLENNRYRILMAVLAAVAVVSLAGLFVTCHINPYAQCLLNVCIFILASIAIFFVPEAVPLFLPAPVKTAAGITSRLPKPPRT